MARFHNINGNDIPFTSEEEIARDAEEKLWADGAYDRAAVRLRSERNALLASSDWTGLADSALTSEVSAKWKLYRQRLRDLPSGLNTSAKVKAAKWPAKP
jgi:hypothetical protein